MRPTTNNAADQSASGSSSRGSVGSIPALILLFSFCDSRKIIASTPTSGIRSGNFFRHCDEGVIGIARPGGAVGYVGVPHGSAAGVDLQRLFRQNIRLVGGVAPVRAYIPELLADVLAGKLDPSPVLDLTVDLAGVPEGYAAMDGRRATKVMIRL